MILIEARADSEEARRSQIDQEDEMNKQLRWKVLMNIENEEAHGISRASI